MRYQLEAQEGKYGAVFATKNLRGAQVRLSEFGGRFVTNNVDAPSRAETGRVWQVVNKEAPLSAATIPRGKRKAQQPFQQPPRKEKKTDKKDIARLSEQLFDSSNLYQLLKGAYYNHSFSQLKIPLKNPGQFDQYELVITHTTAKIQKKNGGNASLRSMYQSKSELDGAKKEKFKSCLRQNTELVKFPKLWEILLG